MLLPLFCTDVVDSARLRVVLGPRNQDSSVLCLDLTRVLDDSRFRIGTESCVNEFDEEERLDLLDGVAFSLSTRVLPDRPDATRLSLGALFGVGLFLLVKAFRSGAGIGFGRFMEEPWVLPRFLEDPVAVLIVS